MKYNLIYNTKSLITSDFNQDLFLDWLKKNIQTVAFDECIQKEKYGIEITVTMRIIENEEEVTK